MARAHEAPKRASVLHRGCPRWANWACPSSPFRTGHARHACPHGRQGIRPSAPRGPSIDAKGSGHRRQGIIRRRQWISPSAPMDPSIGANGRLHRASWTCPYAVIQSPHTRHRLIHRLHGTSSWLGMGRSVASHGSSVARHGQIHLAGIAGSVVLHGQIRCLSSAAPRSACTGSSPRTSASIARHRHVSHAPSGPPHAPCVNPARRRDAPPRLYAPVASVKALWTSALTAAFLASLGVRSVM